MTDGRTTETGAGRTGERALYKDRLGRLVLGRFPDGSTRWVTVADVAGGLLGVA